MQAPIYGRGTPRPTVTEPDLEASYFTEQSTLSMLYQTRFGDPV